MARAHRAYPSEFRQQTVELVQSGRTPDESARRYHLLQPIKTLLQSKREPYGRPRIHAEPLPAFERVSPKRVGRLLRRAGIEGAGRPRSTKTPTGDERAARSVPDLVHRVPVGGAPTHEPCIGQEIVQAKARASARHNGTVIG